MKMIQSGKNNGNMGYFIYGFTVEGYNAWAADRLQKKLSQLTDEEKALCAAFCERAKDVSPESSVPLMRSGHAIELSTVFNHPEETFVTGRLFDETFSKTMRKMWVQFAKTGNPSLAADISPDGCTSIGANAFKDCAELTQIRIPASVSFIDETAFVGCANVLVYGTSPSAAQTFCNTHDNCTFVAES